MRQFCYEVNREELRSELAKARILDETTKLVIRQPSCPLLGALPPATAGQN
jgi:hypothetical protein